MPVLKNIIFDLGGVLIDVDFSKTSNAFKQLGFAEFDKMYSQFKVDQLFEKLETGSVSEQEFYELLLKTRNNTIKHAQLMAAWNSLLLDFRMISIHFLEELRKKYNLYLLSNTNSIHQTAFTAILEKQGGKALDSYFTKTYYSHSVGLRKPEKEIFEYVLKDASIQAAETLFIDDTIDNVKTAAKLGFKTHHFLPGEKIESIKYE